MYSFMFLFIYLQSFVLFKFLTATFYAFILYICRWSKIKLYLININYTLIFIINKNSSENISVKIKFF